MQESQTIRNEKSQRKKKTRKNIPRTRKLKKLAGVREDNNSNLGITKDSQFLSFLEQSSASFRECDLPAICILNPLDLNLPPTHFSKYPIDQNPEKRNFKETKTHTHTHREHRFQFQSLNGFFFFSLFEILFFKRKEYNLSLNPFGFSAKLGKEGVRDC